MNNNGYFNLFNINLLTLQATTIQGLALRIISWILYIAGVLAFIYLVYAGILYITSGGNPDQAKRAQQGLIYAIIGIIVIVLSYAILTAAVNLARGVI